MTNTHSDVTDVLSNSLIEALFPNSRKPLPDLNDIYELELAYLEDKLLSDDEMLRRGAFFARVGEQFTNHFLMCVGDPLKLPDFSSSRLKSFFGKNIFRTGYGTHGLFPYRGKFHPQMIKGLLNVMGLKPGQTVLDPMMGSGTVAVEACLMGIKSIGLDASPFCRFMAQTKIDALTVPLQRVRDALDKYKEIFEFFAKRSAQPDRGSKSRSQIARSDIMSVMEDVAEYSVASTAKAAKNLKDPETIKTYNFLLLAYLDACGYAERSVRKTPIEQFRAILERYVSVVDKVQAFLSRVDLQLVSSILLEGDARHLQMEKHSVDGVLFSPPYSFAIDYLENDSFHLQYFGTEMQALHGRMIGLRGKSLSEKYELYCSDMGDVLAECSRVLRPKGCCTVIVGTNSNQLGKVLGIPPDQVRGLHEILTDLAADRDLKLVRELSRSIVGMSNTMRKEYILIFRKDGESLL